MSKAEKLLARLLQQPVPMDFRWEELEKILSSNDITHVVHLAAQAGGWGKFQIK